MDEMATPSKQVWLDSVSVTLPNYLISALTKPRSQFTRSNLMDATLNFFLDLDAPTTQQGYTLDNLLEEHNNLHSQVTIKGH